MTDHLSLTKEERFIIAAYEYLQFLGDDEAVMDRYEIGQKAGLKECGVNAAFKLFVKANFVRNKGDGAFIMTDNGIALAKRLLHS